MSATQQLSVALTDEQHAALERISVHAGKSKAAVVRDAVAKYLVSVEEAPKPALDADSLWRILEDPVNWARFKALAEEMNARTTSPVFTGRLPGEIPMAAPVYRYQKPEGVASRPHRQSEPDIDPPF